MKSSAITIFSVTAALALGATAAVGGCTINSTTGSDFDGGQNTSSSSGSSSSSSSSGGGADAGDGGAATSSSCTGNQQQVFFPVTCQACLDTKCCDALKACYNLPAGMNGEINCNDYTTCIDSCNAGPPGELNNCYALCDGSAAAGVVGAYEALTSQCGALNCATECGQ